MTVSLTLTGLKIMLIIIGVEMGRKPENYTALWRVERTAFCRRKSKHDIITRVAFSL